MAATGTKQQQPTATPVATVVDPKFEWAEKEGSYVLRLTLTGFRKEDFRVQVDGTGKLTVRGATRPSAGGPGSSLYRVFQLPATASLDDIAGRFEAGVLTLTVRKLASSGAGVAKDKEDGAPPTSTEGAEPKESVLSRTTRQVAERVQRMEEEANRRKQEEEKKPAPAAKKDQHPRPKAPQAATAAAATPEKQGSAIGKKDKAAVDRESLEDRVRLCGDGEEVRAKAAATPTAMDAKAEHEKKAAAATCTAWKERIVGELKGLTDMKWADNTFEIARKNKEVVAVGVAAFSLGFFVSQRLFGK
ncbi:unnamed protein product [Triticum turgidum subsp. durum]|uniref:SHSP domain-containing protein n=1 Tax=Triticum turgidum subsp. durum TaxID=4567 RepID=A0A9R0QI74_TRITD|nr:unnamed protein product [Triticum turgidum subsp. durum]